MSIIKNKRGLSDIVTNVLLIIVTLTMITLTYNIVAANLAKLADIQNSPEYSCLELQTAANKEIEITSACLDSVKNRVEIEITRSALNNIEIQDLTFQLDSLTSACGNSCSEGECIIQDKGTKKTYFFQLEETESPQNAKVFLNSCELDDSPIRDC